MKFKIPVPWRRPVSVCEGKSGHVIIAADLELICTVQSTNLEELQAIVNCMNLESEWRE